MPRHRGIVRIALTAVVLLTSCARRGEPVSQEHATLGRDVGFPAATVLAIRDAGERLRRLTPGADYGDPQPAPGLTIDVPQRRVSDVIAALRKQLGAEYVVFRSKQEVGEAPDEVSVLKSADQFDALRIVRTNGVNYGISGDSVIARLTQWNAAYGLVVRGAALDWVEAEMQRPPSDMRAFADTVYAFCPDVVDQGTRTVAALADEMRRTRVLYLWWD